MDKDTSNDSPDQSPTHPTDEDSNHIPMSAIPSAQEQVEFNNPPSESLVISGGNKSKKPLLIAIGVFLVVAALVAAYIVMVVMNKSSESTAGAQNSQNGFVAVADAEGIVDEVKLKLRGDPVATVKDTQGNGQALDGTLAYEIPSYQPSGAKFSTNADSGFGTATSSPEAEPETINNDYNSIISFLESKKFTTEKKVSLPQDSVAVQYHTSTIVCYVTVSYGLSGKNYGGIGCADVSSYKANITKAQPFYEAYMTANPGMAANQTDTPAYVEAPTIKDGTDGYKNAEAQLIVAKGLFYLVPGQTKWKFLLETQGVPACSKFNTTELQKAFSGTACLDTKGKDAKVAVATATSTDD